MRTIRSRVQLYRLQPLSVDVVERVHEHQAARGAKLAGMGVGVVEGVAGLHRVSLSRQRDGTRRGAGAGLVSVDRASFGRR